MAGPSGTAGWGRRLPPGLAHVRQLGQGGFGEVVLARQTALDRLVAVKRVHAGALLGADEVPRFRREAQLLARVDHPSVVRVLDFQVVDGDALLVMEYVPGRSLEHWVVPGGVDLDRVLPALQDVATALSVVGALGITHRDVKPANVFVDDDGRAKLGDFGIARVAADPSVFRTTDAAVRGTPAYLAPEAGLGGQEPGPASDAYAFAATVFEVLTGRLPYTADDPLALFVAHDRAPVPRASQVRADVPPAVDELLMAGLAKDPALRPAPQDLVAGLAAALPGWPPRAGGTKPGGSSPAPPTIRHGGGVDGPADDGPADGPGDDGPGDDGPGDDGPGDGAASAAAVAALLHGTPTRRRRVGHRRWTGLLAAALVVAAAVGAFLVVRAVQQPAAGPTDLAVSAGTLQVTGQDAGRCPLAGYRAVAELAANGAAGTVRGTWVLPDGRRQETPPVRVGAGQTTVTLTLDFQLSGTDARRAPAVLVLDSPGELTVSSSAVEYRC